MKKNTAVDTAARPVRPPSATPAEDSTKVVTVEVPHTAPTVVATASENIAFSKLGILPSFVNKLPREHAPYNVPNVSNISTKQNAKAVVMIRITKDATECFAR